MHILNFEAVDRAGNVSEDTQKIEFTVDTRPELVNIYGAEDDVGDVTDTVMNGGITDDDTPKLFGTATAGGLVTIYEGDVVIGRVKAGVDGTWEITPEVALSEGAHSFQATVTLPAKGESPRSKPFNLAVDITPPTTPTIVSIYDDVGLAKGELGSGAVTDDSVPLVSGKADPNATVILKDNGHEIGRAQADAAGNWSFLPSAPLSFGLHNLVATAVNKAGNAGESSDTFAFRVVELGGVGARENFNSIKDKPDLEPIAQSVVLPTGLVVTGTFEFDDRSADRGEEKARPEDQGVALYVGRGGSARFDLPSESKKLSFFAEFGFGGGGGLR